MNKNIEDLIDVMGVFNKKFSVYKCEKNEDVVYFSILISCLAEIISSKKFFKKNQDVLEFLESKFKLKFPNYISKNRSLILGRTVKYFSKIESMGEIKDSLNSLYLFISKVTQEDKKDILTWQDVINNINLR